MGRGFLDRSGGAGTGEPASGERLRDGLATLARRACADGGLPSWIGGAPRPDATAWAILASMAAGEEEGASRAARARLAGFQAPSGGVLLLRARADAAWPTALSILAWRGAAGFEGNLARAVAFLEEDRGLVVDPGAGSGRVMGHDVTRVGWSWISGTHSWVMPSALATLALRACGRGATARVEAARALLLDRQLSRGGWNYGNTTVFGVELLPMPEATGLALLALAGAVARGKVEVSLAYAGGEVERCRTPMSLGWLACGLAAWGAWHPGIERRLDEALARQGDWGEYPTPDLALCLVARARPRMFAGWLGLEG